MLENFMQKLESKGVTKFIRHYKDIGLTTFRHMFNCWPLHCLVISEIGDLSFAGKLSWDMTATQVNSASTQPCIPLEWLTRVPALAGVKAGKSLLLGGM